MTKEEVCALADRLADALRIISEQGGDIVERWSAEIARAALARYEESKK